MTAKNGAGPHKQRQWIVTEHRQIVVKAAVPLQASAAFRIAFNDRDENHSAYVVSDHIRRDIYPVAERAEAAENIDKRAKR